MNASLLRFVELSIQERLPHVYTTQISYVIIYNFYNLLQ